MIAPVCKELAPSTAKEGGAPLQPGVATSRCQNLLKFGTVFESPWKEKKKETCPSFDFQLRRQTCFFQRFSQIW
ncbi:hypothetical protein CapIbe_001174 [Capra ibex]